LRSNERVANIDLGKDDQMVSFASAASSWLALNDPILGAELARYYEAMSPRGLEAPADPPKSGVVSSATLIGNDRDRALKDSRDLKNLLNKPEGAEYFRKTPLDGCTSIMNMARVAAGFNPAIVTEPGAGEAEQLKSVRTYNAYVDRLLSAPFFDLAMSDVKEHTKQSSDWNVLIDGIADLFEGVMAEDKASIRKSLVALAKAATSRVRTSQRQYLFTQSVLGANRTGAALEYDVNIYSSVVVMEADEGKGGTTSQTHYQIRRTRLIFRTNEWPQFADKVWAKQVTAVDDWLSGNSTPVDSSYKKTLCIEPKAGVAGA